MSRFYEAPNELQQPMALEGINTEQRNVPAADHAHREVLLARSSPIRLTFIST